MEEEKREVVWYAGLPVVSTRRLAGGELALVTGAARALRLRGLLLAISVPFSLLILTAVGILIDLAAAGAPEYRTAGALLLTLLVAVELALVVPFATAAAFRALKRFRLLQVDMARGDIDVCSGLAADVALAGSNTRRIASRLRGLSRDDTVTLDVLPVSASLLNFNAVPLPSLPVITKGATSSTPEFASIAAKWTKPLETLRGFVQYNRRSLSDEEKKELRSYLPNIARRSVWLIALHALLIYQLTRFFSGDKVYAGLALLSGTVAFFADRRMLRIMTFHRKLRHDIREGWVLIVKESEEETVPAIEYLPATGAEWTHAGAPSLWRKMYGKFGG